MPIYEFYCTDCHTIFNFLSTGIDVETRPACPRCGRPELPRKPSSFAMLKARGDEGDEDLGPLGELDEDKMASAFESMAGEMETLEDQEDPRAMARFFRKFGETSGLQPGPRMEDLLQRLESGEDLEALEDEMGDDLEDDESFEDFFTLKKAVAGTRRSTRRPRVDETLYRL